ncbi:hypothetical protein Hanom_Chr12g01116471 [Helianthus anomalus]
MIGSLQELTARTRQHVILQPACLFFSFSLSLLFDVSFGICRSPTTGSSGFLNMYANINTTKKDRPVNEPNEHAQSHVRVRSFNFN